MEGYRYTKELVNFYTSRGWWTDETWADIYGLNAQNYPEKIAFIDLKKRITWKEVHNCIENVVVKIALEKAGLIFCFAAMNLREVELDHFLKTTKAKGVVTSRSYHGFDRFKEFKDLRESGKHSNFEYIFTIDEDVPEGAISIDEILKKYRGKNTPKTI